MVSTIKQCLGILVGTGTHQHPCWQCVPVVPPIFLAHGNKMSPKHSLIHKQPPDIFSRRQSGCYLPIPVNRRIEHCRGQLFHVSWCQFQKKILDTFKLLILLYPSLLYRSSHCILCMYEEFQAFVKKGIGINKFAHTTQKVFSRNRKC